MKMIKRFAGKYGIAVLSVLLGYLFVQQICEINILHFNKPANLSLITGFFAAVSYAGYSYWKKYQIKWEILLFSFVFSVIYLAGFVMRNSDGAGVFEHYAKELLLAGAAVTPAAACLVSWMFEKLFCKEAAQEQKQPAVKVFLLQFVILIAAWLPVFLAYFPGIFAYDVHTQVTQMNQNAYTTHHPLIHTLLLRVFYRFGERMGSYNLGVVLYTCFQMLLMAASYAYVLWYLYDKRVSKKLRILLLLFFGLCPIHSLLTISATKDTLFSAFMLVFVIVTIQILEEPGRLKEKRTCMLFVVSGVLTYLFRNNAKYAMLLWILVLCLFYLRKHWKKAQKGLFIGLLAGILLTGQLLHIGMVKLVDAKPGSMNEMLSIPSAQIARCYFFKSKEMAPELAQKIAGLGITPGDYVLSTVDIVKGKIQIENQKKYFLETWWEVLKAYPGICIDAFLYINQGNLSLEDISNAYVYGASLEGRMGYLITNTAQGYGVEHHTLFPQLETYYEQLFSINEYQDIPVLSILFVPAFYFWGLLFGLVHALVTGRRIYFFSFLLLLCYFATVLLGPCALIRYSYPLVAGVPVLLALELGTGNKKVNLQKVQETID